MWRTSFCTPHLWFFALLIYTRLAFADGMVFPQQAYPAVEIPGQQAFIHHEGGIEHLVIETAFLGEGTNFAWIVPLPAPPEVRPVSTEFFPALVSAFQPSLIHPVAPYYAAVLFVFGLGFLGWRSLKDEVSWLRDIPFCILLAVGAGLFGHNYLAGLITLALLLIARLFVKSAAIFALVLLVGTFFSFMVVRLSHSGVERLILTMGSEGAAELAVPGVTVLSVQQAGLFETTTIRGQTPAAILTWLNVNGYQTLPGVESVLSAYIKNGWVFVASKARRPAGNWQTTSLHPLAFTFASAVPVYPTRLTALTSNECRVDLYVFGSHRASASRFKTVRCDRLQTGVTPTKDRNSFGAALRIRHPEVLKFAGHSTIGTKLSGNLTAADMRKDVLIKSRFFLSRGRWVFSHAAARMFAVNVAVTLGAAAWALLGMTRGGWDVRESWILRWRILCLVIVTVIGVIIYQVAPRTEIQLVPAPDYIEDMAGSSD